MLRTVDPARSSGRGRGSTRRSSACAAPGRAPTRTPATSSAPPSPTAARPWPARSPTPARRAGAARDGACRAGAAPEDARAEALSPGRVRRAGREAERERVTPCPDANPSPRQAQPLPLPRAAPRGRPARALLAVRAAGAGRRDRGLRGRAGRGRLRRGRGREPRRAGAGGAARAAAGSARRCGSRSRSGSRSPPGSAAAAPTPPRCCGWRATRRGAPSLVPDLAGIAAELGADVPSQLDPARSRWSGAPARRSSSCPTPAPHAVVLLPGGGGLSTAAVFAEADRLGLGRDGEELDSLAARLREAAGAGASPLDYAELLANDLEPAARSLRPDIGAALDALRAGRRPARPAHRLRARPPSASSPPWPRRASAAAQIDREDAIVCEAGRAP